MTNRLQKIIDLLEQTIQGKIEYRDELLFYNGAGDIGVQYLNVNIEELQRILLDLQKIDQ